MVHASEDDKEKADALLRMINVISKYNWAKGWVEETSDFDRAQAQKTGRGFATERPIASSGFEVGRQIYIGGYGTEKKKGEFRPFIPVKLPPTPKELIRVLHGYLSGTISFAQPQTGDVKAETTRESVVHEGVQSMSPEQQMVAQAAQNVRSLVEKYGISVMFSKNTTQTAEEVRDVLGALQEAITRIAQRPTNTLQAAPRIHVRCVSRGEPLQIVPHMQGDKKLMVIDLPPHTQWREVYNASIGVFL